MCHCDLSDLIYPKPGSDEDGKLDDLDLVLTIATQIASALTYIHSAEVAELIGEGKNMHLDMKPGNVLLLRDAQTAGYTVRVADFG